MTPEELMRPRYKVIADYFYNPYKTGDIITVKYDDRSVHLTTTHYRDEFGEIVNQHNYFHPNHLGDFPHLFKKLEWWEERKIEEMPEYLYCPSRNKFFKVEHWGKSYFVIDGRQKMQYRNYIPATREEYEQYKQKDNAILPDLTMEYRGPNSHCKACEEEKAGIKHIRAAKHTCKTKGGQ